MDSLISYAENLNAKVKISDCLFDLENKDIQGQGRTKPKPSPHPSIHPSIRQPTPPLTPSIHQPTPPSPHLSTNQPQPPLSQVLSTKIAIPVPRPYHPFVRNRPELGWASLGPVFSSVQSRRSLCPPECAASTRGRICSKVPARSKKHRFTKILLHSSWHQGSVSLVSVLR